MPVENWNYIWNIGFDNVSPFQVCLPAIVTEFLRQSKQWICSLPFNLDDYLENPNFLVLLAIWILWCFWWMEMLDMFFPFDLCLLKRSNWFIFFPSIDSWMKCFFSLRLTLICRKNSSRMQEIGRSQFSMLYFAGKLEY